MIKTVKKKTSRPKLLSNQFHSVGGRARGFTLLELLVVIGILSLIMSILLPSLKKARIQAKNTQCLNRLRAIMVANTMYIQDHGRFPALNNMPDDGTWQYNYLIYDGRDFESNFGPLIDDGRTLENVKVLYCPFQTDPFHSFATAENPWPVVSLLDTRSSYGRRYHLSGKSISQLKRTPAFAADVFHLPKVIKSGHKTGVNAVYIDGHASWIRDDGFLTDNELTHPFEVEDNDIVEDIWDRFNEGR